MRYQLVGQTQNLIIMKETWLLVCGEFGILDKCLASSKDEASDIFKKNNSYIDWSESDILSEADYMNELELNSFECQ